MKFIVGLGNPDPEYRSTKHNVGFEVVKAVAKANGIRLNKKNNFSVYGKGEIAGEDVTLVLPQTYMNHSGNAVAELAETAMKEISDLVVVCDDIALTLGKIRMRKAGSSGGHKGLESIAHALKTDNFARLRVGIATDIHKGDITRYVLSPFKRSQRRHAAHAVELAADCIESMFRNGIDKAMSVFNKRNVGVS